MYCYSIYHKEEPAQKIKIIKLDYQGNETVTGVGERLKPREHD